MNNERLYGLLDITSLGDLDNPSNIAQWTRRIAKVCLETEGRFRPAAICVYAPLLGAAREGLGNLSIPLAAVAGNFPSGKSDLKLKSMETLRAIDAGANEIDWVIDRGAALYSKGESVIQEVQAAREACGPVPLKVIFETGQIEDEHFLFDLACKALNAGADFLKTSTGKIPIGATEAAARVLCSAIKHTNASAGFKASGGIRDHGAALRYVSIYETMVGKPATPSSFRLGASTLAIELLRFEGISW
ncbi:MAG: deoxyribose-phosphate aldolase [Bacteroidetes bacterium]|nr:deoxyribose-phosphate aldolase [Bacteroidota bacterium]